MTLPYSSFASLQNYCNDFEERCPSHMFFLSSLDVCLCPCTEERGGEIKGGGGGENDEKCIIKRLYKMEENRNDTSSNDGVESST